MRSAEGPPLGGVTVTISGSKAPLGRSTTTLSNGAFRFVGLFPGTYRLLAKSSGKGTFAQDVAVQITKDTKLHVTLSGTEAPPGRPPVIDALGRSATDVTKVIRRETLRRLPLVRSYSGLFPLAPGVAENASTAPNAGGGRQDNTFLHDGVNVTNPFFGDMYPDFSGLDIEEVAITRGGLPAESGRTGGFLVNAVTRSGTNDWHGEVLAEYQPAEFNGDAVDPTLDRTVDHDGAAASLGGPVSRDHVFFYGSASLLRWTSTDRVNRLGSTPAMDFANPLPDSDTDTQEFFWKLTASPTASHSIEASLRSRDSETTDAGIGPASAASAGVNTLARDRVGAISWLWALSRRFSMEARFHRHVNENKTSPVTRLPYRPPFDASRPDRAGLFTTGEALGGRFVFPPAGDVNQVIGAFPLARNDQDFFRDEYQWKAFLLARFFGASHDIRVGATYSDNQEDVTRIANGWGSITMSTSSLCGPPSARPCFRARYFPEQRTRTSEGRTYGVFMQDQISWGRISLNLGLLFSRDEFIPNSGGKFDILRGDFTIPNDQIPACNLVSREVPACTLVDGQLFDLGDQLQPRLGVAVSLDPRMADKLFAHYGRYSNMDNHSFARAAAPTRPVLREAYFDSATGDLITEVTGSNQTNKLVLETLHFIKTDEILGGYARSLKAGWSAQIWGMYRKTFDILEDFPGTNRRTLRSDGTCCLPPGDFRVGKIPGAYRKYQAITLEARRAAAEGMRWTLDVSYTLSRLEGNWDLDYATSLFYSSSYIEDGPGLYVSDPNREGLLIGDRTHVGKIFATYELPTHTTIGGYLRYQSGRPWEARGFDPVYATPYLYLEPAGSRRMSSWTNVDLLVSQRIPVRGVELRVEVRILNLFDEQPELSLDQAFFLDDQNALRNPEFGRPVSYAPSRCLILAGSLTF